MPTPRATIDGELLNPTEYVAAAEMETGKEYPVEIASVQMKDLQMVGKNQTKRKAVVSFRNGPKPLVLNRTNEGMIARLHGTDAKLWAGKMIAIYRTTTKFGRETVDCIRVAETVPQPRTNQQQNKPKPAPSPGAAVFTLWAQKTNAQPGPGRNEAFAAWVMSKAPSTGRTTPWSPDNPIGADEAEKLTIILQEQP
jgi:hypothetical protein